MKKTYIYADRQILAEHDGGPTANKYFYMHDRLGSVRLVIDYDEQTQNVSWSIPKTFCSMIIRVRWRLRFRTFENKLRPLITFWKIWTSLQMDKERLLGAPANVNGLARRLARSDKVNNLDTSERKECGTLAHCFSDLEESFLVFLDVHLPKLMRQDIQAEEIEDVLFDIGQEFNHILYHLRDPKYFRHMLSETEVE